MFVNANGVVTASMGAERDRLDTGQFCMDDWPVRLSPRDMEPVSSSFDELAKPIVERRSIPHVGDAR
jgi:hypothetical protein